MSGSKSKKNSSHQTNDFWRQKSTGVDVAAALLEKIRTSFCTGMNAQVRDDGNKNGGVEEGTKKHVALKQALMLCMEELEGQGFDPISVQHSVANVLIDIDRKTWEDIMYTDGKRRRNVSSLAQTVTMRVMNDLLCRLSREELPTYYADGSTVLDQARVAHVSSSAPLINSSSRERSVSGDVDVQLRCMQKHQEDTEKERVRVEEAQARKQEEKERRNAWILQNVEESDSTSVDEDEDKDDASIEDWELWGTPEEIEQKKAEKARSLLSREDKIAVIAHDMHHAKMEAAAAKARKDKDGQKQAGALIGRLRRDMQELGIVDEDLAKVVLNDAVMSSNVALDAAGGDRDAKGESSDQDEPLVDFDLFDNDAPDEPQPKVHGHMAYSSIILNTRLRDAVNMRGKKGGKAAQMKAGPVKKHPKAILQQLVQKEGWGAPRFEKLSQEKQESEFKYRFQILIDVKQSGKKGKQLHRPGIHRFSLPAEIDGWDTIQQAQDACATKALMELYGGSGDVAWETLKEPFDALIFDIAEHQGRSDTSSSESKSLEREKFLDSLLGSIHFNDNELQDRDESMDRIHASDHEILEGISAKRAEFDSMQIEEGSKSLHAKFTQWKNSEDGLYWMKKRDALPVSQIRTSLLTLLERHDVVLVSGETGSGKTTQVPQIVLDGCIESLQGAKCSVVCTQPRRIAAISVADRVSEERGEAGPGKRGSLVGYSVRFDSATHAGTRLEFCTTGILLRRLSSDPALAKFSHIIVDEVHERTMQSDFLIAMLRDLVEKRRQGGLPLKVILMSATMNTEMVSDYFFGCPILNASGRTYPVQQLFLEDVYETTGYVLDMDSPAVVKGNQAWRASQKKLESSSGSKHQALIKSNWGDDIGDVILNEYFDESLYEKYSSQTIRNLSRVSENKIDMDLLEHVVMYIHESQDPGAILVFVPGIGEIGNLSRRLVSQRALRGHVVVPLHSSISPSEQKNAFKLHPPGVRKIVISTNIAETSVTIEDIVYVVDTGKHKERRHDASRSMSMLVEDMISVANANQRKGRAGRVQEGVCYSLYTRTCYENRMKRYQTPEIMRVPLEEMILQIHHLHLSNTADEFLSKVMQPPQTKSVVGAIANLIQAGALTKQEELTPLGGHLAQLPVDVNVGKILIMGTMLHCLSPVLSISACLSHKSPFVSTQDKDDMRVMAAPFLSRDKKCIASDQQSDHLVLAAVLQGWIDAKASGGISTARKYAQKYNLSVQNINIIMEMRDQFASMLENTGLAHKGEVQTSNLAWYDSELCPENANAQYPDILRAVLVASLYPKIAVIDELVPGNVPTWHDGTGSVAIHPTSLLSNLTAGSLQRPFMVYSEKMKTTKIFLRDCTIASPLSIFLFGSQPQIDHRSGTALIDGWIRIRIQGRCAAILLLLRDRLEKLLENKVDIDTNDGMDKSSVMDAVIQVLKQEQDMLTWKA